MPDPALLDRAVATLREIERRSGIERTLAIGELILTEFFAGDPRAWRDRRRNKNNSVRRLADRKDCPFCKSALNEAVAVYVAVRELPCVRTFGHITASHVASVLKLPGEQRQAMLERAERERWSVRELRENVVLRRRAEGERRGRPPVDAETRTLSALRTSLRELQTAVGELSISNAISASARAALGDVAGELETLSVELRLFASAGPDVTPVRASPPELAVHERSA